VAGLALDQYVRQDRQRMALFHDPGHCLQRSEQGVTFELNQFQECGALLCMF
jgi:hypothetical protein